MTTAETTKSDVPVDRLTRTYIKIRDARAKLGAEYKEQDGDLLLQLEHVKRALLDYCADNNVESVRTSEGLVYRTTKTRYWTGDWSAMHRFILDRKLPEFFEKRLNQTAVKEFLEENPDESLPGLKTDVEYVVTVRKK